MSDLTRRIESEKRQLLSMKQHKDALAAGDLTEADVETMAIERIRTGKTSGRRPHQPHNPESETALDFLGWLHRDEGDPLFQDPWWVSAYVGAEPGVDDDQSALPFRMYRVYLMRRGGKRYVCLGLDWEPA